MNKTSFLLVYPGMGETLKKLNSPAKVAVAKISFKLVEKVKNKIKEYWKTPFYSSDTKFTPKNCKEI